jgi:hypothetical protein
LGVKCGVTGNNLSNTLGTSQARFEVRSEQCWEPYRTTLGTPGSRNFPQDVKKRQGFLVYLQATLLPSAGECKSVFIHTYNGYESLFIHMQNKTDEASYVIYVGPRWDYYNPFGFVRIKVCSHLMLGTLGFMSP